MFSAWLKQNKNKSVSEIHGAFDPCNVILWIRLSIAQLVSKNEYYYITECWDSFIQNFVYILELSIRFHLFNE